jgi:hypothetical protein
MIHPPHPKAYLVVDEKSINESFSLGLPAYCSASITTHQHFHLNLFKSLQQSPNLPTLFLLHYRL